MTGVKGCKYYLSKIMLIKLVLGSGECILHSPTESEELLPHSDVGGGWGTKQKHAVLVTGAAGLSHSALLESLFPQHKNITSAVSEYTWNDEQNYY